MLDDRLLELSKKVQLVRDESQQLSDRLDGYEAALNDCPAQKHDSQPVHPMRTSHLRKSVSAPELLSQTWSDEVAR